MGQSFSFVDIIFLAVVTGFLVLRLRSVLGRRPDGDRPPKGPVSQDSGNVIPLPRRDQTAEIDTDEGIDQDDAPQRQPSSANAPGGWSKTTGTVAEAAQSGVRSLTSADKTFDPDEFMTGARAAFEIILTAYAQGDLPTLSNLLAPSVYDSFAQAINDRVKRGETMVSELISFKSITLVGAALHGKTARVTMRFVTEQMLLIKDRDGAVLDGSPTEITEVTDEWTFERVISSRDPNWSLVMTATPNA